MDKLMELRSKRAELWERTKAFLEDHRGENGNRRSFLCAG